MANAVLVIKTANGYVVVPHPGQAHTVDFVDVHVASSIGDRYSTRPSVVQVLEELLEPKELVSLKEVA